jgi:transmembrane sensor
MKRFRSQESSSAGRTIEKVAANWLGLRDGGLTATQQLEFAVWLKADPRHAEVFAQLHAASHALDRLEAFRPSDTITPDPDLPLTPRARRFMRSSRGRLPVAFAAAAALAVR